MFGISRPAGPRLRTLHIDGSVDCPLHYAMHCKRQISEGSRGRGNPLSIMVVQYMSKVSHILDSCDYNQSKNRNIDGTI